MESSKTQFPSFPLGSLSTSRASCRFWYAATIQVRPCDNPEDTSQSVPSIPFIIGQARTICHLGPFHRNGDMVQSRKAISTPAVPHMLISVQPYQTTYQTIHRYRLAESSSARRLPNWLTTRAFLLEQGAGLAKVTVLTEERGRDDFGVRMRNEG